MEQVNCCRSYRIDLFERHNTTSECVAYKFKSFSPFSAETLRPCNRLGRGGRDFFVGDAMGREKKQKIDEFGFPLELYKFREMFTLPDEEREKVEHELRDWIVEVDCEDGVKRKAFQHDFMGMTVQEIGDDERGLQLLAANSPHLRFGECKFIHFLGDLMFNLRQFSDWKSFFDELMRLNSETSMKTLQLDEEGKKKIMNSAIIGFYMLVGQTPFSVRAADIIVNLLMHLEENFHEGSKRYNQSYYEQSKGRPKKYVREIKLLEEKKWQLISQNKFKGDIKVMEAVEREHEHMFPASKRDKIYEAWTQGNRRKMKKKTKAK